MILLIAYVTYALHAIHKGLKRILFPTVFVKVFSSAGKNPGKILQGTPATVNVKINISLKHRIEIPTVT